MATMTIWATLKTDDGRWASADTPPVRQDDVTAVLASVLGTSLLSVEPAGGGLTTAGIYRVTVDVEPTPGAPTLWDDKAYRDLEKRLFNATIVAWASEPVVTLWQRTSAARVFDRTRGMVVNTSPHPTMSGVLRIVVYGVTLEEVFHLLDDRSLWDDEPAASCTCKRGCAKCRRTRIQPPPRFGYAGCGGP